MALAARIFKSRTIASEVVKQGHVKVGGKTLKPSSSVGPGDALRAAQRLRHGVRGALDKRVGAPIAITCYRDVTPAAAQI